MLNRYVGIHNLQENESEVLPIRRRTNLYTTTVQHRGQSITIMKN